jgi:hypothetical protein
MLIWLLAFVGFALFALSPIWVRRGNGVDTCITCGDPITEDDDGFCERCYIGDQREQYEEYMESEAAEERENARFSLLDGRSRGHNIRLLVSPASDRPLSFDPNTATRARAHNRYLTCPGPTFTPNEKDPK